MTLQQPAPPSNAHGRPPRRQIPRCPRPNCGGNLVIHRYGDDVAATCIAEICRLSARTDLETRRELVEAREAAHDAELELWTTLRENHAEADADWP